MTWQVYSVDTATGAVIGTIEVSSFQWARALSAGSTGQCTIPLAGTDYTPEDLEELTDHWSRTIVLEQDGEIVFAGLVARTNWDDGVTVTVSLTDIWGLWARRGGWDQNAPFVNLWSITYTGMSLGTLAKRVVQRATDGPILPVITLPVTLPSDVSGSLERTYYGYHLEYTADVLSDLVNEGVEIDFRARWVDGALDWEMVTDPTPDVYEWFKNAPDSGMVSFRRVEDGARITNNPILVGEGSGVDLLARSDFNAASTRPRMDRLDPHKNISDADQLTAMAAAARTMYEEPTSSWTFDILANGDPLVGVLKVGDTARLTFSGDRWIADGSYDRRIVRLAGSLGETVTVTCQSTGS